MLHGLPRGAYAYFNHGYFCDARSADTLAYTDYGGAYPSIVGRGRVYGFQFHLEFTEPMIQRLATEPQSQEYIAAAGVDPKQVVAETGARVAQLSETATEVFRRYFQQCGL